MNFFSEWFSGVNHVTKKALAFTLAGILVFSVGFAAGTYSNVNAILNSKDLPGYVQSNTAAPAEATQPAAPTETTTQPTAPAETPSEPAQSEAPAPAEETQPAAPADNGSSQAGAPTTPEEILNCFNNGINKVKTDATSVTRNYEDIIHNADKLEVPSALKKTGESLIGQFVKGDFNPVTYSTKEEITANFPVHDEAYSSKATINDIESAECTDDGTYYNITLKFKTSVDPGNGVGVGSAFNCMKSEDVMNAASFIVKNFSVEYYDCIVECQIDKATGNAVKAKYTCNDLMSVDTKISISAKVGLTFIDDYTINY